MNFFSPIPTCWKNQFSPPLTNIQRTTASSTSILLCFHPFFLLFGRIFGQAMIIVITLPAGKMGPTREFLQTRKTLQTGKKIIISNGFKAIEIKSCWFCGNLVTEERGIMIWLLINIGSSSHTRVMGPSGSPPAAPVPLSAQIRVWRPLPVQVQDWLDVPAGALPGNSKPLLEQEGRINAPPEPLFALFAVFLCSSQLFNPFLPKIAKLGEYFQS